jgi:hypothetical protein
MALMRERMKDLLVHGVSSSEIMIDENSDVCNNDTVSNVPRVSLNQISQSYKSAGK